MRIELYKKKKPFDDINYNCIVVKFVILVFKPREYNKLSMHFSGKTVGVNDVERNILQ